MPKPDSNRDIDVIVIGGGPAGENVAQYAHEGGLDVVLIERELLGGECSYYACMPSKALLRPLDVRGASEHLSGLTAARLDPQALLKRRDAWVSHYNDTSQMSWAAEAGLFIVRGHGRLAGPRVVEVVVGDGSATTITARVAVVIATGSAPVIPDLLAGLQAWDSRDATGVAEVPGRLLIVGGGVVACEAATWMAALGSQVTMLVRGSSLLAGQEPFASKAVAEALRDTGVRIVFDAKVISADRDDAKAAGLGRIHGGEVRIVVASGEVYRADELLVAAGRRPRLNDVGLEAVGLRADDVRDDHLPSWLHVIGDAGTGAALTHMGKYEARLLGARLAGAAETPAPADVPVPQVIFTDPQIASVGLTEAAAREAGLSIVVAEVPFTSAAGTSLLRDDGAGTVKVVVDSATHTLIGATFCGHEAAELVHAATIAIVGKVPVDVLRHAVPSYPTSSELWLRLLEQLPRQFRTAAS